MRVAFGINEGMTIWENGATPQLLIWVAVPFKR